MSQINYCPHCGKKVGILEEVDENRFRVLCDSRHNGCGATGGIANSIEEALEKWNARVGSDTLLSNLEENLVAAEHKFKQEKDRKNNYNEFDLD